MLLCRTLTVTCSAASPIQVAVLSYIPYFILLYQDVLEDHAPSEDKTACKGSHPLTSRLIDQTLTSWILEVLLMWRRVHLNTAEC